MGPVWARKATPTVEPRAPPSKGLFDAAERAVMVEFCPAPGSWLLFHHREKEQNPRAATTTMGFNLVPFAGASLLVLAGGGAGSGRGHNRCESALSLLIFF